MIISYNVSQSEIVLNIWNIQINRFAQWLENEWK